MSEDKQRTCTVLSVELVCFSEPLLVVKTEATEIRLPSVSAHQGDQTREAWLARLKRADLKPESYLYVRVCSDHFVKWHAVQPLQCKQPRLGSIAESRHGMTFTPWEAAERAGTKE